MREQGLARPQRRVKILENVVITALRDSQGKLVGFSKITKDLRERKRADEALEAARSELARVARVTTMGEMTASVIDLMGNRALVK
jgi:C4-dicarboxylate-specific signal transduction histidine kinase